MTPEKSKLEQESDLIFKRLREFYDLPVGTVFIGNYRRGVTKDGRIISNAEDTAERVAGKLKAEQSPDDLYIIVELDNTFTNKGKPAGPGTKAIVKIPKIE
ncbi:hypothetical protein A3A76_00725 [Candidatus Woesebacteria bacterium RIFCSPLOWO2_01_FULL_39_23]|uniref:Uncharacterized protein n=1 Tax=Candidatus Woesebacteria bacterium RIFCSPHIGHO2_01_FULL_40_22 TaxID=1802499 RepID=A0A1F7YHV9_9BACT|nr:MAG: hypothetical protein A2141_05370 [Candidatus Woesebacteria bacterium RBG_16_40_11]OGM26770.1 MAG: hypothetical protein A2628_04400 [Candidatus Woesebacteria bacterium RIFCSPHIGHO2_01_FULL_40_22]OGM37895.1 MAG: hypothetical protein A3E41_01100 [Candidatus Woesebacteria bacterium RIFCSPHIGHO2_12_FULL_38_9]OGM63066.1 MAG: hypothetical protein A3A76_00725 [Candidatus Woesebacteria bacterium RIFCSPLOWO2_01_FULL_39_23]